jgi:glycosyltransferase involved in cell wall biosynthesis
MLDARYVREKPSGIGSYVQALVQRLPALAPDDRFTFWRHPLAPRPLSTAANVSEIVVRTGPNSPWSALWRDASFAGVDVFHNPHNLLPRGIPCRTVVTIHDLMALEHPRMHLGGLERISKSYYYPQAIRRALREATCLIAPSRATADRICALAPEAASRLTITPEAADAIFQPPNDLAIAQKKAGELIGSEAPYLLVVGANTPSKRHDLARAAFVRAVPAPWQLVFLQRRKARQGLHAAERVLWLEAVTREEVVILMQAAGALVQPSLYEGFGLPVLEAMACGCPIVASDIPPLREVTGGAALLIPPGDVERLAVALTEIVNSPQLRSSLGKQAEKRASDFSWDRCAEETLQVYRHAAGIK